MDPAPLLAALAALAAAAAALLLSRARRRPHCGAPHVPGLPLLGSALALGRWGAAFLSACRDAVGRDAFCLHLGFGQRMVFLFEPKLVAAFMTSPEELVAFKPAVRRFTQRCAGEAAPFFGCVGGRGGLVGGAHTAKVGRAWRPAAARPLPAVVARARQAPTLGKPRRSARARMTAALLYALARAQGVRPAGRRVWRRPRDAVGAAAPPAGGRGPRRGVRICSSTPGAQHCCSAWN